MSATASVMSPEITTPPSSRRSSRSIRATSCWRWAPIALLPPPRQIGRAFATRPSLRPALLRRESARDALAVGEQLEPPLAAILHPCEAVRELVAPAAQQGADPGAVPMDTEQAQRHDRR